MARSKTADILLVAPEAGIFGEWSQSARGRTLYSPSRSFSSLFALCLAISLLGCKKSAEPSPDALDVTFPDGLIEIAETCGSPDSQAAPIPIDCVNFIESPAPNSAAANLEPWLSIGCTGHPEDVPTYLECSTLKEDYSCQFVRPAGPLADWLDHETSLVTCESCQSNPDGPSCFCSDGLHAHSLGEGGKVCEYLFLAAGDQTTVIRTPAEFVSRFAPVDDAPEALAFVALLGQNIRHLFARTEFMVAATRVPGVEYIDYETHCSVDEVRATSVQADETGFLVRTFQVPDYDGCGKDALTEVTYHVTTAGDVQLQTANVICTAEIPCYD